MSNLKKILKEIDDLPVMPDIALKLVKMTADLNTDISELIMLIAKDQSLTAKLLKLCKSPYYGLTKRVSSLQQAVVLLGYTMLYKIALTISSSAYFKKGAAGYGMSVEDLRRHSVGAAIASEIISNKINKQKAEIAYITGLLHDIGKIVISEYVQEEIDKILELTASGKTFIEAENEIIGMDHAMIGGKLGRKWKLPEPLVESIKYHHEPHLAVRDKELCSITHLGNVVITTLGAGLSIDSFQNQISHEVIKTYPLHEAELEEIILITHQRLSESEEFIKDALMTQPA